MRKFDYKKEPNKLLTPEIVSLLTRIYESKGKQELFIEASPDILNSLLEVAKIQSTDSSNRIEGIHTTSKRLEALVEDKVKPRNRSEEEILGYRDVLTTIHENYDYIPINTKVILQLHRNLYSYSNGSVGGNFKSSDNPIIEKDAEGNEKIRFKPVSAFETEAAVFNLCEAFNYAIKENKYDPLILIPMFVLDFLCIHPFMDGNGRMSRLLTLLLLYKSGYIVGKYISIEMFIEKTKESYYETLELSSTSWHQEDNNYGPFVVYYLSVLQKAYTEFEDRVDHLRYKKLSKMDRIKNIIDEAVGKITKKEIMMLAPDISQVTIERALTSFVKDGYIEKVGSARSTAYVKKIS